MHIHFIRDLINHWRDWPNKLWPPRLKDHAPYKYTYKFSFSDVIVSLNVNNHNIIDKHNDPDENRKKYQIY